MNSLQGFEATLQHAHEWQGQAVEGWQWSEKLDGVRARWNGGDLFSRNGNLIALPLHLQGALPAGVPVDLEIYAGRGRYETARQAAQYGRWVPDVRLVAFDLPTEPGDWLRRIQVASTMGLHTPACGTVINLDALRHQLRRLHQQDGEGLMLAAPGAAYAVGRTYSLLKFKHEALYYTPAAAFEVAA